MKDGLILMYVKDGTIYPVALSKEQVETFEFIQSLLPQPIKVIKDRPQGQALNLLKEVADESISKANSRRGSKSL